MAVTEIYVEATPERCFDVLSDPRTFGLEEPADRASRLLFNPVADRVLHARNEASIERLRKLAEKTEEIPPPGEEETRPSRLSAVGAGFGRGALAGLATSGLVGAVWGAISAAGAGRRRGAPLLFAIALVPELIVVPALGLGRPPWRWSPTDMARTGLHHGVYSVTAYTAFSRLEE